MKEKSILTALTSTLILGLSAKLTLLAQEAQPYQGVVGRTLAESKEWWPEPAKASAGFRSVAGWPCLPPSGCRARSAAGSVIWVAPHGISG